MDSKVKNLYVLCQKRKSSANFLSIKGCAHEQRHNFRYFETAKAEQKTTKKRIDVSKKAASFL